MRTEAQPKKKNFQRKNHEMFDGHSFRSRLLMAFLLFALFLLGSLYVLQTVFLESYYEISMKKRAQSVSGAVSLLYSDSQKLDIRSFGAEMGNYASDNDIYLYLETTDGTLKIVSSDYMNNGRFITGGQAIIDIARYNLDKSGMDDVSFTIDPGNRGEKVLVTVALIRSRYRSDAYLFTVSRLTPMDSAIGIITSQLMVVTLASLIIAIIIALWYSKMVARPITRIRNSAKLLGEGNYDVEFEGGPYTEIQELATTLTHTASELKKADSLQRDLLANVSHDLRTPLTMIKSYAELIRDISGDSKERRDEHLGVIIEETDRLSELVGDILTLSRIQSGAEQMHMADVDIQAAAESVLATYRVLEENENFIFDFRSVPGRVLVTGDERRLQQVFSNLISNAVRYSDEIREVSVSFSVDGDVVRCEVADRGIGIAQEELDRIWNRYEKVSSRGTRCLTGGTGLGLSITREVLERHGALYGVDSVVGEGSRFWFSLPCRICRDKVLNPPETIDREESL